RSSAPPHPTPPPFPYTTLFRSGNPGHNHFNTPSEALEQFDPVGEYDAPQFISWADTERDLTAWRGNAMQANALEEVYRLERPIKQKLQKAQVSRDAKQIAEARYL